MYLWSFGQEQRASQICVLLVLWPRTKSKSDLCTCGPLAKDKEQVRSVYLWSFGQGQTAIRAVYLLSFGQGQRASQICVLVLWPRTKSKSDLRTCGLLAKDKEQVRSVYLWSFGQGQRASQICVLVVFWSRTKSKSDLCTCGPLAKDKEQSDLCTSCSMHMEAPSTVPNQAVNWANFEADIAKTKQLQKSTNHDLYYLKHTVRKSSLYTYPRLSDPCNFITVLYRELEQTMLLFGSMVCSIMPHGLHTADRR